MPLQHPLLHGTYCMHMVPSWAPESHTCRHSHTSQHPLHAHACPHINMHVHTFTLHIAYLCFSIRTRNGIFRVKVHRPMVDWGCTSCWAAGVSHSDITNNSSPGKHGHYGNQSQLEFHGETVLASMLSSTHSAYKITLCLLIAIIRFKLVILQHTANSKQQRWSALLHACLVHAPTTGDLIILHSEYAHNLQFKNWPEQYMQYIRSTVKQSR